MEDLNKLDDNKLAKLSQFFTQSIKEYRNVCINLLLKFGVKI